MWIDRCLNVAIAALSGWILLGLGSRVLRELPAAEPVFNVFGGRIELPVESRGLEANLPVVFMFGDLEAPDTGALYDYLNGFQSKSSLFALVFKHLPVGNSHPHAFQAALSVECARAQSLSDGFLSEVLAKDGIISTETLLDLALELGIERQAFSRCLDRGWDVRLTNDIEDALRLKLSHVPAVAIGRVMPEKGVVKLERVSRRTPTPTDISVELALMF